MYYFLHSHRFLQSIWTLLGRSQENVTVSAIYTFFLSSHCFLSIWASFRHCWSGWTFALAHWGRSCSSARYWFSNKVLGKTEHWPDEEQQIFAHIHQNLLLKHPLCPTDIRAKDLSNQITTEGFTSWRIIFYLYKIKRGRTLSFIIFPLISRLFCSST